MASTPVSTQILWPDATAGPWLVRMWWRVQHGAVDPVGFEITSWIDDDLDHKDRVAWAKLGVPESNADVAFPTIDSQMMRGLPIGQIAAESRKALEDFLEMEMPSEWSDEDREDFATERADLQAEMGSALRVGPRTRDLGDAHYREVAAVYRQAVREGDAPTRAVEERFTISRSAAAKQVARARERGFLPKTTRGRIGRPSEEL